MKPAVLTINTVSISTRTPPRTVVIDGTAYPLRSPASLRNPLNAARAADLAALGTQLRAYADDPTKMPPAEEISRRLKALTAFALPTLPPLVAKRLSDDDRWAILDGFIQSAQVPATVTPAAPRRRAKSPSHV